MKLIERGSYNNSHACMPSFIEFCNNIRLTHGPGEDASEHSATVWAEWSAQLAVDRALCAWHRVDHSLAAASAGTHVDRRWAVVVVLVGKTLIGRPDGRTAPLMFVVGRSRGAYPSRPPDNCGNGLSAALRVSAHIGLFYIFHTDLFSTNSNRAYLSAARLH